jgi:NO-binding membrane sensor protein with MHYT domain
VPMTVTNPFAFGAINPIVAFAMALVGSLFGLSCLVRARRTTTPEYARRWLIFATCALAIVGIWLTHFIAVLGFDVPESPVRYSVLETVVSLLIAIAVIGLALQIVGTGRPSITRVLFAGLIIGGGVSAMHYLGVAASRVEGFYTYNSRLVVASVLISVVGSLIALALTVWTDSYAAVTLGGIVFAIMVASVHYTGMVALQVHLIANGEVPQGISAVSIVIPVTVGGILTLLAMLFAALGMMSDDGIAVTVDRQILDAELVPPIRPTWHIPPQPPREPADEVEGPTRVVSVTSPRRHFR